jgi:hypothetical protein
LEKSPALDFLTITVAVSEFTALPLEISYLSAASDTKYQLIENLDNGKAAYIDRSYTYASIPEALKGLAFIMTANSDKMSSGDSFLSFQVNKRATVYLAHDDRITDKPDWMRGLDNTGLDLAIDVPLSVYARVYEAGLVSLRGNGGSSKSSMYAVVVSE